MVRDFNKSLVEEWQSLPPKQEIEEDDDETHFRKYAVAFHNLLKLQDNKNKLSRRHFTQKSDRMPDPVSSIVRPDSNFGSVSENLETMIDDYLADETNAKLVGDVEKFKVRL